MFSWHLLMPWQVENPNMLGCSGTGSITSGISLSTRTGIAPGGVTEHYCLLIIVIISPYLRLCGAISTSLMNQQNNLKLRPTLWRAMLGQLEKLYCLLESVQDVYLGLNLSNGSHTRIPRILQYIRPSIQLWGGTALGFNTPITTAVVVSTFTSTVAETAAVNGSVEDLRFRPSWAYLYQWGGWKPQ